MSGCDVGNGAREIWLTVAAVLLRYCTIGIHYELINGALAGDYRQARI